MGGAGRVLKNINRKREKMKTLEQVIEEVKGTNGKASPCSELRASVIDGTFVKAVNDYAQVLANNPGAQALLLIDPQCVFYVTLCVGIEFGYQLAMAHSKEGSIYDASIN